MNKNSPVRFHAIGSVDTLHLTTPGVEKKNDHVRSPFPGVLTRKVALPDARVEGVVEREARGQESPAAAGPLGSLLNARQIGFNVSRRRAA